MKRFIFYFLLLIILVLQPLSLFAQSNEGRIRVNINGQDEYWTESDVASHESKAGQRESLNPLIKFVSFAMEDHAIGKIISNGIGFKNPYTYDSPETEKFLNQVRQINGDSKEDIVEKIYNLVTETVPNYSDGKGTLEKTLSCGEGICRDQAQLLHAALKEKGMKSDLIASDDHIWVRVKEGIFGRYDLDPTWYKNFVKLEKRTIGKTLTQKAMDMLGLDFDQQEVSKPTYSLEDIVKAVMDQNKDFFEQWEYSYNEWVNLMEEAEDTAGMNFNEALEMMIDNEDEILKMMRDAKDAGAPIYFPPLDMNNVYPTGTYKKGDYQKMFGY